MKERVYRLSLAILAILCIVITVSQVSISGLVIPYFLFPFKQLGDLLHLLSTSGRVGNGIAWVLYVGICLLPCIILTFLCRKRQFRREDSLLIVLSIVLFRVMYVMVNPSSMSTVLGDAFSADYTIQQLLMGGTIYSILFGYLILRFVHSFFEGKTVQLYHYLRIMLTILGFLLVVVAFGSKFSELLAKFISVKAGNTDPSIHLELTFVFLGLRYLVDILPYGLNLFTILLALRLLEAMKEERYSETVVELAIKLTQWCKKTLCIVIITNVIIHILQLLCIDNLLDVQTDVLIPVSSILFVIIVLVVARIITENHKLKDDNDLFI